MNHFSILGKNFPQSHLIIVREYPQNNVTHILRYFNNFPQIPFKFTKTSFTPPATLPQQPFNQRYWILSTEFLCKTSSADSLLSLLVSIYQSFSPIQKMCPSKHTKVFERKNQPYEMVKSLCESVVVLKLQIYLTQSPTMIFNQW